MRIPIETAADLGLVLRAVRKSSKVRLDDLAVIVGVSKQFASDVERGKATVQLGRTLQLLAELGVRLQVELPESAEEELVMLRVKGGLKPPLKRRLPKRSAPVSDG